MRNSILVPILICRQPDRPRNLCVLQQLSGYRRRWRERAMNEIPRSASYVHSEPLPMEQRSKEALLRAIEERCDIDLPGASQRIWELLETPQTVDTICRVLAREHAVSNEACSRSVKFFL